MEEDNILTEEKPRTIKLADGKDYKIPLMNLTTLANLEQTMGFGLAKLQQKMIEESATTLRLIVYALLKENHPGITLEKAGELVTFENMKDVSEILSKILAM
jgi:hypothetical protein